MTWAQRLKRVFKIDIETRYRCGGAVLQILGKRTFETLFFVGSKVGSWPVTVSRGAAKSTRPRLFALADMARTAASRTQGI